MVADYQRFDELTAAAQWRIEENAESCPVASSAGSPEVRFSRSQEAPGADIIRIFFVISSETECSVISVDAVPDPMTELGS